MAQFPRTLPSAQTTTGKVPTGLVSRGQTGAVQLRSEQRVGRSWTEVWSAIKAGTVNTEALLAFIEDHYRNAKILTVDHPLLPGSGKAPNGAGGGTPLVNGASQSGTSLITDGWPATTLVIRAGDCFKVNALNPLYRLLADGTSDGGGNLTLTIDPGIASGNSPATNAALTLSGNLIRAYISDYNAPPAAPDEYLVGLSVTFEEAP